MSKKKNKGDQKQPQAAPVNRYRKIVLILNPVILAILAVCILVGLPPEAVIPLAVVGYGIWGYLFFKSRAEDRKIQGR